MGNSNSYQCIEQYADRLNELAYLQDAHEYDSHYIISQRDLERNSEINPANITSSVDSAITLLTNPKCAVGRHDISHCQLNCSLEDFNTKGQHKVADYVSQIKITSPRQLTPKLYLHGQPSKPLICNFSMKPTNRIEDATYHYQAEYFNNPDGHDVYLNIGASFNNLYIDIQDQDSTDVDVQFILTFIQHDRRNKIAGATNTFGYPTRTLTYSNGCLKVQSLADPEKKDIKDINLGNDYDLVDADQDLVG